MYRRDVYPIFSIISKFLKIVVSLYYQRSYVNFGAALVVSPYLTTLYEKTPPSYSSALTPYYLVGLEAGGGKGNSTPAFLYVDGWDLCVTHNVSGTDMSTP